jgi:hypothetical protein
VSKPSKRVGRRSPPCGGLIGCTDVSRLLGCSKRTVRRRQQDGFLVHAVKEPDGVLWYDEEKMRRLAETTGIALPPRHAREEREPRVETCTEDEIRAIHDAFEANVPHEEIGRQFGKSIETIRYLYAQACRGLGVRRIPPSSRRSVPQSSASDGSDYFPERQLAYAPPPAPPRSPVDSAPHSSHTTRPTTVRRELPMRWLTATFDSDNNDSEE